MKKELKRRKGFTLIEMTIVLFIISLLILIIIPNMSKARQNAQNIHGNAMTSVVQSQIDAYFEDHPNRNYVDYDILEEKGYLTSDQVSKAKDDDKINITKNDNSNNSNDSSYKATK